MQLKKLQHLLQAQNRHGVHSPLVYRLVDDVLLRQDGRPVKARIREHFAGWVWQEVSATQLPEALAAFKSAPSVFYIQAPHGAEAAWIAACTHPAVSLAIDCWDFGLLLATPDIKAQQYFRLRYKR